MVRGDASSPGGDSLRVRDLLDVPGLGLRLLTSVADLDRVIKHVYTTDLPDPSRYLTPGDLVLTGMIWCREPGDAERFVAALVKAGGGVSLVRRRHRGGGEPAERGQGDRHDPGARAAQAAAFRGGRGRGPGRDV